MSLRMDRCLLCVSLLFLPDVCLIKMKQELHCSCGFPYYGQLVEFVALFSSEHDIVELNSGEHNLDVFVSA